MNRAGVCRIAALAGTALLGGACLAGSLVTSSRGTTHVDSRPSGADVFVMGEHVGRTPLDVEDRSIFPVHYPPSLAALYGRIVLERPGCDRVVRTVDLRAANEGIVVDLHCVPTPTHETPPPEARD